MQEKLAHEFRDRDTHNQVLKIQPITKQSHLKQCIVLLNYCRLHQIKKKNLLKAMTLYEWFKHLVIPLFKNKKLSSIIFKYFPSRVWKLKWFLEAYRTSPSHPTFKKLQFPVQQGTKVVEVQFCLIKYNNISTPYPYSVSILKYSLTYIP